MTMDISILIASKDQIGKAIAQFSYFLSQVLLWHVREGGELRPGQKKLLGHTSWVRWCRFTEDSRRLISSGDDQARA